MTLPSLGGKKIILARKPLHDFARPLIFLKTVQYWCRGVEPEHSGKSRRKAGVPVSAVRKAVCWALCMWGILHWTKEHFHAAKRTRYFPSDMKHSWSPKRKNALNNTMGMPCSISQCSSCRKPKKHVQEPGQELRTMVGEGTGSAVQGSHSRALWEPR